MSTKLWQQTENKFIICYSVHFDKHYKYTLDLLCHNTVLVKNTIFSHSLFSVRNKTRWRHHIIYYTLHSDLNLIVKARLLHYCELFEPRSHVFIRSGCRNVIQCHLKQSFLGLRSPGSDHNLRTSELLLWKLVYIHMQTKLVFTWKAWNLACLTSLSWWGSRQLGNGLF